MNNSIDMSYETYNLTDIVDIERGNNSTYPAGTIHIRISATDRLIRNAKQSVLLGGDYVIFKPKRDMNPAYLKAIIDREFPRFLEKYVGTNINIQVDNFKYLKVNVHNSKRTQDYLIQMLEQLEIEEELERKTIEQLKNVKKVMLSEMMI